MPTTHLSLGSRLSSRVWIIVLLISSCATPSILVTQEQQAGDLQFNQHNYPGALNHYLAMLDASQKLGIYRNLSMEADVHRKIANCYEMTGKYDSAETHVRESLAIDSLENNILSIIEDHRMLGKIDLYRGLNFEACRSFEKALELSDGMDQSLKNLNKNEIAENQLALAQLYITMGRFSKALSYSGISLNLFRETGNERGELEALLAMASVYYNSGDHEMAKSLTKSSQTLAEKLDLSLSRHMNNFARISAASGEYEDAVRFAEQALSAANTNRIAAQRIWFTVRLGDLYRDMGDNNRSLEYYKRAQDLRDTLDLEARGIEASLELRAGELINARDYFTAQGSDIGAGITSLRLAELANNEINSDKALAYLRSAEEYFSRADNRPGMANVNLQKAIALTSKRNYTAALNHLELSLENNTFPEIRWQVYFRKGMILEEQDKLEQARDAYLEAISIIEEIRGNFTIDEFKSNYLNNKIDVYGRLIEVYLKINKPVLALEYTERAKARSFFEMLANNKISYPDTGADSLLQQEEQKRFEIQQLYRQLQNAENLVNHDPRTREINRKSLTSELNKKQAEHSDILLKLKLSNPAYADIISFSPVDHNKIISGLDTGTAILSYWIGEEGIHIWCINNKGIAHKSVPASKTILIKLITDARTHIATNATALAKNELKELYSILIAPVINDLGSARHLVIIPNSSLHFLPFQALLDKSDNNLVSNYNITYEPSLGVHHLKQEEKEPGKKGLFGAALADVAVGLNIGLPGTEDELKKILPYFDDQLSSFGEESTETFIKENIGKYSYIHLATHGIFNFHQPAYSFLLFPPNESDDGRLTVHEVMGLKLDSRLVTLSACETGLGYLDRGDEIVGLSRSFLYAGSSAVIVSLWSVADYQTSLLMSKFYSYIDDYSLEEALAMAQREVMKEYPNPFFWSPFILIGNGK